MKIVMINDFVLKRIVARIWKYADDLLFSLACYHEPGMPPKPFNDVQDTADFVTFRVPKGNLGVPVINEKCVHVKPTLIVL